MRPMTEPRALILFAGAADGWGVGLKRAGARVVALAESEPDRRAALRHHHPGAVIYDDVRTVTAARLRADLGYLPRIVVGSPPCQDISCANNGRALGVDGARSGLYFEFVRIVGEVRPDWFAAENAAQLKTRGYERIAAALEGVHYACWPQVVGARETGFFHLRKRSWLAGVHVSDAQGQPLGRAGQPWQGASDAADASGLQRPRADTDLPEPAGRLEDRRQRSHWAGAGVDDRQRRRIERRRADRNNLPAGLAAIERAAQALGLGGRSRLTEHYRMAHGVRSGLARLCISAYGDALVPDIAEAFALTMMQLVVELRGEGA